jgi:hypothetical protein
LSCSGVRTRAYLDGTHIGGVQKWVQYTILKEGVQFTSKKEIKATSVKKEVML